MTAWCADHRVRRVGRGYEVTSGGTTYHVLWTKPDGWGIYVEVEHAGRRGEDSARAALNSLRYASADDAIGALLGGGGERHGQDEQVPPVWREGRVRGVQGPVLAARRVDPRPPARS